MFLWREEPLWMFLRREETLWMVLRREETLWMFLRREETQWVSRTEHRKPLKKIVYSRFEMANQGKKPFIDPLTWNETLWENL